MTLLILKSLTISCQFILWAEWFFNLLKGNIIILHSALIIWEKKKKVICKNLILLRGIFYSKSLIYVISCLSWQDEEVYFESLVIINKMLIVCREKFAKFILTPFFLEALTEGVEQWLGTSIRLTNMVKKSCSSYFSLSSNFQSEHFSVKLTSSIGSINVK